MTKRVWIRKVWKKKKKTYTSTRTYFINYCMDSEIFLIFTFLFFLSAFFSASELALMSLAHHKIESFIKQNKFGAKDLKYIKEKNDKLLISILILNNLVNVYIASFATQIAIGVAKNSTLEEGIVVGIATWIITLLIIMFGEIVPKSYATKNAENISLFVAKFYKWVIIIFTPLLYIIEVITKITTGKGTVPQITDEEIESFIDMGKTAWVFEAGEHEKIKNMLEFSDISVEEIFTPRVKIDAISENKTVNQAIDFVLSRTHSRIPVYQSSIDQIEYVVNIRFLLAEQKRGNGEKKLKELKNLDKVIKIPLNHPIDTLLDIFKNSRKHLAVVIDEYGWVAWLVTLEDIIEEVFWDIRDEYDKEKDEIKHLKSGGYEVDGGILFEDLLDELDLSFADLGLDEKDYFATTLGYFITEELERFPEVWEVIVKEIYPQDVKEEPSKMVKITIKELAYSRIESVEVKIEDLPKQDD